MSEQMPLTIEQIHKGSLEVLKVIIGICEELDINYYLAYGTLLGAIRHKGFIPWDDDLDIMMVRRDYDRFLQYCYENEEKLLPYRLLFYTTTDYYPYTIPRFSDTRCRMENDDPTFDVEGMGYFVDIYPLDGIPNDSEELVSSVVRRKKLLMNGYGYAVTKMKAVTKKNPVVAALRGAFRLGSIALGPKFFIRQVEKFAQKYPYDQCDYITNLTWEDVCLVYEKKDFADFALVDFEDIKAKVPAGFDNILRAAYGDYMTPPPEEDRVGHHFYKLYKIED